jgi:glycosyltransferase involved in cell wall biosynthesis
LGSLARQKNINLGTIEVLIVDNNCTDNTALTTLRTWWTYLEKSCHSDALRKYNKASATPGTGQWRSFNVLIFTDDDVRLEPGWLAAYQDAIHRFPDADYFG